MNTDPANPSYAWSSPKVYGPQAYFVNGPDASFPITGNLTNGSAVVTGVSSVTSLLLGASVTGAGIPSGTIVAILGFYVVGQLTSGSAVVTGIPSTANMSAGMAVQGAGIPSHTTIASVNNSHQVTLSANATATSLLQLQIDGPTTLTLSQAATTTSSGATLTVTNPGYISLPATDNGYFLNNNYGSQGWMAIELRSTTPHGLVTGRTVNFTGDAMVPVSNVACNTVVGDLSYAVTGTLTGGSAVVTGLASTNRLAPGLTVYGALTVTGTVTAGSLTVITGIASTAGIAAGSFIFGTGVTNGTQVVSTTSTTVTVSNSITAGSGVTFNFTTTIASVDSSSQITLAQPVNVSGSTSLIVTGRWPGSSYNIHVFVTGPYTLAAAWSVQGGSSPTQAGPQTVASTAEISLISTAYPNGWSLGVSVPSGAGLVPYEYSAAMVSQLPGCGLWINIPFPASDGVVTSIAQRVIANIGATNPVYLELGNEVWNGGFLNGMYFLSVATLVSYVTSGTVLGHAPAPTGTLQGYAQALPLASAHAYDVFTAAWTAAGRSPSLIRRVLGSFASIAGTTQSELSQAQRWGLTFDHVAIAPYQASPTDWPVVTAFSPLASPVGGAGSWPIDAINDYARHAVAQSITYQSMWGSHSLYCQAYGQPLAAVNIADGGAGGSLAAGSYYLYYTFVDGSGRETTVGQSQSGPVSIAANHAINIGMPPWPLWRSR